MNSRHYKPKHLTHYMEKKRYAEMVCTLKVSNKGGISTLPGRFNVPCFVMTELIVSHGMGMFNIVTM